MRLASCLTLDDDVRVTSQDILVYETCDSWKVGWDGWQMTWRKDAKFWISRLSRKDRVRLLSEVHEDPSVGYAETGL